MPSVRHANAPYLCPECWSAKQTISWDLDAPDVWTVKCESCGCTTPASWSSPYGPPNPAQIIVDGDKIVCGKDLLVSAANEARKELALLADELRRPLR